MVSPCTYGTPSAAAGASMVSVLPELPTDTTAVGNSGLPMARSAVPGISGYKPSADQTYQALISPRSSLPGMPPGASDHN